MAKPNSNQTATRNAAQAVGPGWQVSVAHESDVEDVAISTPIDVRGCNYLFVYNTSGSACLFTAATNDQSVAGVPLYTEAGVLVSVATATARLVSVKGCHYVIPDRAIKVVYTY